MNNNIPTIHDNIPKTKQRGINFLFIMLLMYIFVNSFIYYDIYSKINMINITIDTIQTEQMSRTDKVYNGTKDRFYRQDFKDWLASFKKLNEKLDIPHIPDKSPYEL